MDFKSRWEQTRPLSQRALEELTENLDLEDSDLENVYESEDDREDGDQNVLETISETEDNIETNSEEESDAEPNEVENIPFGPKYIAKSGMSWESRPFVRFRSQKDPHGNLRHFYSHGMMRVKHTKMKVLTLSSRLANIF